MEITVNPKLHNREQARKYLGGISERTLTSLVTTGELKAVYIGRRTMFHITALETFAKRGTSAGYEKK